MALQHKINRTKSFKTFKQSLLLVVNIDIHERCSPGQPGGKIVSLKLQFVKKKGSMLVRQY